MCGRYALEISMDELAQSFGVDVSVSTAPVPFLPNYNIVPTSAVPFIAPSGLGLAHWGWSIRDSFQINARSETLAEKPSFRNDIAAGRCLIPASAFYEWQHKGERKGQPYLVRSKEDEILAFAGLHRRKGNRTECVIITANANEKLQPIHSREPVMMPRAHWRDWLQAEVGAALPLLKTSAVSSCELYAVSVAVNSIKNNDRALLEKIELSPVAQGSLF